MDTYRYQVRLLKSFNGPELQELLNNMGRQGYRYRDLIPISSPPWLSGAQGAGVTTDLVAVFEQNVSATGEVMGLPATSLPPS